MRKLIMIAIFGLLLLGFGNLVSAESGEDESTSTPKIYYSDTILAVLANQCKSVSYTEWSPCISNFNVQIRNIIKPVNNCTPNTNQQVEQIRFCDSHDYFGYNIKY